MAPTSLQSLLAARAIEVPNTRITIYPLGNVSIPFETSYFELYAQAKQKSRILSSLEGFKKGYPVLLHLSQNHWDFLLWFWATLLANGLPVASSPFSHVPEHRLQHIQHLCALLESPLCLTSTTSLSDFNGANHSLRLHTVESLQGRSDTADAAHDASAVPPDSHLDDITTTPALLMLTSGSTGVAKAVLITHGQALASVAGKLGVRSLGSPPSQPQPFLNWVGLDHVAALLEIHLQALWAGAPQVHVHAADVVAAPCRLLNLVSRHRVSRTFAPHFFLARLEAEVRGVEQESKNGNRWDLQSLKVLGSGGEANDVETCASLSKLLARYGAPANAILPGFGMTETCAGAIYNAEFPDYDVQHGLRFASLGKCMPCIEMRVTLPRTSRNEGSIVAPPDSLGDLQVRGAVVFRGYYRDRQATADAFTADGWFRTGDTALIDGNGNLRLIGRVKDVFNINGVKIGCGELQSALESAVGPYVKRVVCFPSRTPGAATEQVTVAFIPSAGADLLAIHGKVINTCVRVTTSQPTVFSLPDDKLLPVTTLGKIQRAKLRELFEELDGGVFKPYILQYQQAVIDMQATSLRKPTNAIENTLLVAFAEILNRSPHEIGTDDSVFDHGCTSIDLIRLKQRIDSLFHLTLPLVMLIRNPTILTLAIVVADGIVAKQPSNNINTPSTSKQQQKLLPTPPPERANTPATEYDPVVVLRAGSTTKTPLWLVHPGVGEVLVFLPLAAQLATDGDNRDRPIYALRARGFEPAQAPPFASIDEATTTYVAAIRRLQPAGPYALAGYSYGACLAFEAAKRLHAAAPGCVRFLGSFNLPPHIRARMRQLNWRLCLLHLGHFLSLVSEDQVEALEEEENENCRAPSTRTEVLDRLLAVADTQRLAMLGLDARALAAWTDVAAALQGMAADYEPRGAVPALDVFCAVPLRAIARSKANWVANHLRKWEDFVEDGGDVRFHDVEGAHYTMIGPEHVRSFAAILMKALAARGV